LAAVPGSEPHVTVPNLDGVNELFWAVTKVYVERDFPGPWNDLATRAYGPSEKPGCMAKAVLGREHTPEAGSQQRNRDGAGRVDGATKERVMQQAK
jgi:hypothetical protein